VAYPRSYALCNAQTELRVKAVAAVSTFNLGDARRRAMGLLSYEERMKRLKEAGEQRSKEARGEPVRLVPVVPDTPEGFTDTTPELYRQGYEYYRTTRAMHPNSPNRYAFSSLPLQMAYFPFDQIETIAPVRYCSSPARGPIRSSGAKRSGRRPTSRRNSSSLTAPRTWTCTTSRTV
jgi:hypothetical protein